MSNDIFKLLLVQDEKTGDDLPVGTGTYDDPYNWYGILDPNNPNRLPHL